MEGKVTVSAPGKLMLLGEHAVVYNHPCLVTAVDQRMRATVEALSEPDFELEAEDVKVTGYKKPLTDLGKGEVPKGANFVEIAIRNFREKYPFSSGLKVTTKSEFSSQFGFGSSSASTVCTLKALAEMAGQSLSSKEIFDLAYKTVLDIQGKGSGFDVAAAIYGGTLYFFTGGKLIEPLGISDLPLVIGYSGIKADTVTLINQVKEKADKNPEMVNGIYSQIEALVNKAKEAILKANWPAVGNLMNQDHQLLQQLGVSIEKLDSMCQSAIAAGAYGAKLSGAGGGDCMTALVAEEKKALVEEAIEKSGGTVIKVKPAAEGVRIEK
jgi:mevalonate kinase